MTEPALLADHLDAQTEAILAHWRAAVQRQGDVPEAERLSPGEFLDHVPALLDRLAERLRGQPVDAALEGKKHGQLRWRQGYDIGAIVVEFGHLRTALNRATADFAQRHGWDVARLVSALGAIDEILDEATAESVRQFQEDSRAQTQEALAEVKKRQVALEDAWIVARGEELKLKTILRNLPAAVWVVDAEGVAIGVNNEADRLLTSDPSATPGRVHVRVLFAETRFFRPDGSPFPVEDLPILRALRGETVHQEELIWTAQGERRTVSMNAAPLINRAGALDGAVGVALDVSGPRELEASLAESEARFRIIAEKSPVMIWRTDASGRCDYVNQTWIEFRGRDGDDEFGDLWAEGIHPDDRDRCLAEYRAAFERREPFELVYRFLRKDGQYRWISDRATPYHDPKLGFLGYLGSCLDITERIELEKSLEQQRELAEESSQHKSRLVSALSHDARTPLNAVVLAAQLLESHIGETEDPEVRKCLRTIRLSVRNVLDLLRDLLNLSRIDAGALPAEVSRFPLDEVLAECQASIEPQARLKGIDVRLEPGPLAGVTLETDRTKLKQILANLLSNALRYTEQGQIRIFGEQAADEVRIGVEDTGIGIDPADQGRIFDEFAILDYARRTPGEGTGLGLAICRRLASLLRGEILLKSARGQGSTFVLVLPSSVLTLAAPEPDRPDDRAATGQHRGAILVAEDHVDSRQTLARVLRRMGYRVLEAGNGRDALAIAEQERLLAVLMDVNMPIMDGVQATLALRADPRFRDLPIFALTGDVTLVNQHRIGEAGVNGYLEKPITLDVLKQALGRLGEPTPG
jgi:two-component system CheB/CheR fusion protein